MYKVYQDPCKGTVIADSVKTTTPINLHIHMILSVRMVLSICVNDRKLLSQRYIEGAIVSISHNTALSCKVSLCPMICFYNDVSWYVFTTNALAQWSVEPS